MAATTPTLAAEEIAYVYQAFGSSLFGFEIGNECDLYGSSYFTGATWNLSTFEALWTQFRTAIVAQTPAAASLCTGPADAGSESSWTVPFGQYATKSEISLLTQHYYRGNGQSASSTAANLVTPDTSLVSDLGILNTGAKGIGVPFRISECNSYYNGGADGVSDAYCSSLWIIDYLFDCALNGAVGANFHGGGNGDGYTPIADSGGAVVEARPEYYGILLFALAGQGTLYTTSLSGIGSLNITAYAVKSSSGGLNLIIVNKDSAQNLQLTVQLPQSASSATLLEMTQLTAGASGPSLSATSGVTIQGASVGANGSFSPGTAYILSASGTELTCYVPYLSAVLIQIRLTVRLHSGHHGRTLIGEIQKEGKLWISRMLLLAERRNPPPKILRQRSATRSKPGRRSPLGSRARASPAKSGTRSRPSMAGRFGPNSNPEISFTWARAQTASASLSCSEIERLQRRAQAICRKLC